jgi:UDP-glucose 4-epimerase
MTFIETIERFMGKKAILNFVDMAKGDVLTTYADISKAQRAIEYNPYTCIGFRSSMFFTNEKYAMSGRPIGPYTVKKRRPTEWSLYRCQYTCAISSFSRLVAAYKDTG